MRRLLLIALVLAGIVAFAAEPTTSTEADIHDGRAHGAYLSGGSSVERVAHAADPSGDLRLPTTLIALAALLSLLAAARSTTTVIDRVAVDDGAALAWVVATRRGPPARA